MVRIGTAPVLLAVLCAFPASASAQLPSDSRPVLTSVNWLAMDIDQQSTPQQQQPPPLPRHTGASALWHGTISDFKEFPRRKSTWAFLAIGTAGALVAHQADGDVNHRLTGNKTATAIFKPGKYLGGWTQVGAGVTTYVVGRYFLPPDAGTEHSNKFSHLGFDLIRAQIITQTLTHTIKKVARRDRPTGECCSFPSGHAASTFATAAVLERHLHLRGAWPTIAIASYVAASRLHDNRHFLSDVVFGAALGTATGWTVVGTHGRSEWAMMPVKTRGGVALMFSKY